MPPLWVTFALILLLSEYWLIHGSDLPDIRAVSPVRRSLFAEGLLAGRAKDPRGSQRPLQVTHFRKVAHSRVPISAVPVYIILPVPAVPRIQGLPVPAALATTASTLVYSGLVSLLKLLLLILLSTAISTVTSLKVINAIQTALPRLS